MEQMKLFFWTSALEDHMAAICVLRLQFIPIGELRPLKFNNRMIQLALEIPRTS